MFILPDTPAEKINYLSGLVVLAGPVHNISVLVQEKDGILYFPADYPKDKTAVETAAHLLYDLTGVLARCGPDSTGFVDLILCSLHDNPKNLVNNDRTIYTIYGCILPQKPSGNFVSVNLLDENMKLMVSEVTRKL